MFNVVVSYNLSNSTASSILNPVGKPTIGITESNNILNTNPGFKNAGSRDYTLTSSSTAINRGTTVGVPPVTDGDPDIGAYEFSEQDGGAAPLAPRGLSIQ